MIAIDKQMPPEGVSVLCWQKDSGFIVAFWSSVIDGCIRWQQEEFGTSLNTKAYPITHWMPLPKSPDEDTADGCQE